MNENGFVTFFGGFIVAGLVFWAASGAPLPKFGHEPQVAYETPAPVPLPELKPIVEKPEPKEEPALRAEAQVIKKGVPVLQDKEIKWQVPEGTTSVIVRILEKNGRLINEYEISRFITIRPGQKLHVLAK